MSVFCAELVGCGSAAVPVGPSSRPVNSVICAPTGDADLQAWVTPPVGWKPDPLKITDKSWHRVWISPSGSTAYGVIYFNLPLPVGVDLALWGFLQQMKQTTGEAIMLFKAPDPQLPGMRFVADGGHYRIRCNLMVSGFHGWAVYAGSLRARSVNAAELRIAEQARDQTRVGLH